MTSRIIVRAFIRGRVQGVGYRAWTQREAQARGLAGWVRNRREGFVEVVLAGPAGAVEAMLVACGTGPSGARVEAVERCDETESALVPAGAAEGFTVLPTV
ncbi:acylphosphatase [Chelatococcus composti]|jgi:acylphosphatase|uniref:acylphosphatase n=1 Tax=Chelatococcus composti TaxID=1743235 RepID=A0A841K3R4_9HYPH|nr:acylphosphatase [Chelatococcus composti]MBB6166630.1 acylphosphatase [Chelatococcus composti]MBS7734441.1 acylphosphatase [Chelatococcus composti]PZN43280.1 MAG: acylphosphatase [Pseudomonadota bacterium]GGG26910.1 acylphosphatase [Chelatococcus composti]